MLQRGLFRRIDNGTSTSIWRDRWIPLHFDGRPITPPDGQEVLLVSDLITADGHWNEDLVRGIFLPIDAEAILPTPTQHQDEDWWAWDLEKHGEFTVKSAYRKLADMSQAPSRLLRLSREVQVMRHGKIFGN